MNLLQAKAFFYHLHDIECNQKYANTLPYSFHLSMVQQQAELFKHLMPKDNPYFENVHIGIYGHDAIEDARMSYGEIKDLFGEDVAEIIYLCTENRGRTRADRKPNSWYEELKQNDLAVFVKLCDITANIKFSFLSNSSMFKKYKQEYSEKTKPLLYTEEYKDIFNHLDKIFEL